MFKVGDEVLIRAKVLEVNPANLTYACEIGIGGRRYGYEIPAECIVFTDKTYSDGLSDAWELAGKLVFSEKNGGFSIHQIEEIFGTSTYPDVFRWLTAAEALAKIEAYEKEKEIKVGDEVAHGEGTTQIRFFVTLLEKNRIEGYDENGYTHAFTFPNPYIKKTEKHIDIEGVLRQIGE